MPSKLHLNLLSSHFFEHVQHRTWGRGVYPVCGPGVFGAGLGSAPFMGGMDTPYWIFE